MSAGSVATYFLLLGGTRIVLGAANGVAKGLEIGLQEVIVHWLKPTGTTGRRRGAAKKR
jgi:hypothetical protein